MPEFPTPPPPLALPLAPSFSRFPPPPDLPSLPTDANFRRRILPKSAAAGASSSPYLVAPVEAKNVPEKGRYWPWDPGIFKAGDDGKPFPPPVKLIYGVPLKSRFSLCSPCLRDDECWFSAKDDRSVVKSGHWEVKYLKDVVSSIPSTPPNKPKHMNRIWMSMALPWPHLSYLGQMFVFISCWSMFFVFVASDVFLCSADVAGFQFP